MLLTLSRDLPGGDGGVYADGGGGVYADGGGGI